MTSREVWQWNSGNKLEGELSRIKQYKNLTLFNELPIEILKTYLMTDLLNIIQV